MPRQDRLGAAFLRAVSRDTEQRAGCARC
jgi:hypothetical protein